MEFEVLCVTTKGWNSNFPNYHRPITGIARLEDGMVMFKGMRCRLLTKSTGLSSCAIVYVVRVVEKEEDWELYINLPAKEGITDEYLRTLARQAIRG